uniref:Chitin-binding type-2 domain-containing protein n=1 Tax=Biomphalaria glabrata TaxID=6526 RepID=A0A2C9LAP5_BIOGL
MTLEQRDKMARSFQHQAVFFLLLGAVLVNFAASQDYCQTNNWRDDAHPHPVYCDRFVKCDNFQTTIVSCPAGTLFDAVSRTCMNAASVTTHCNDAGTTATPVTVPPSK